MSYHITPAIDIWALAVVMFTYYTDMKPFAINCKTNNMRAIASLVGVERLSQLQRKYRYNNVMMVELLGELEKEKEKYQPRDFADIVPKANKEHYTQ